MYIFFVCGYIHYLIQTDIYQQTFTCWNSVKETVEKGLDMFKVNNKDTRMTHILHLFLVFLLVTLNGYICYVISSLHLSLIRMNFHEYEL